MSGNSQNLTPRDRAFAELARARGWADDAAVDRALAEASTSGRPADIATRLRAAGILSDDQVSSLWEAVDGVQVSGARNRSGTWGGPASGVTVKPGGSSSDATLRPAGSSSDATIRPGGSSSEATIRPGSGSASGATLTPGPARPGSRAPVAPGKAGEEIGPYRLMRELGRGGMGVVYRAMHVELRREVALKIMLGGIRADDPDTERFRREAGLVARVGRHPNLVAVHEIGRDGDRLYFTMDYIDGKSAKQRVDDDGAYPPREAASIAADIAGALEFVHRAGVLHRDVKPHNILVDRSGRAFLSDFGLAKASEGQSGLTLTGAALGTPSYMAPEIAARGAKEASPRSDVYSLGATLYEMLTGRPPFVGLSGIDLIRAVAEQDAPSARASRPELHPDLDVVCEKAMEKDPARRYGSAAEMERDLRRFLNGEPIHARPASTWERLLRRGKRNARILAATAVVLAALAAVGGWSGASWWRKEKARRAGEDAQADLRRRADPLLQEGIAALDVSDEADVSGRPAERDRRAARAAEVLAQAAALLPADAEIRFQLGRALRRSGKPLEALDELEKAVALNPNHTLAWFEHGMIAQDGWLRVRGTFQRHVRLMRPNEFGFRASKEPVFQSWIWQAKGTAERPWKEIAARDFERAVGTGARKELASYGRAMLLYLDGKHAEALAELDEAVKLNPYFAPALAAQAEIREYSTQKASEGLEWRGRLAEIQPRNPAAALEYAVSLAAVGRGPEARDAVLKALEGREVYSWLAHGAWTLVSAMAFPEAEALARRALAAASSDNERTQAATILREALLFQKRFAEARQVLDDGRGLYAEDYVQGQKGADFAEEGNYPEAVRCFRAVPESSAWRRSFQGPSAWAEYTCGNLHRAKAIAAEGLRPGEIPSQNLPIIRMDLGELDKALAEFEAQAERDPDNAVCYSNLSGVRFLKGDYPGAMDALEQAFLHSPVPQTLKDQVKQLFVDFKKRAKAAKTPAEAGKVVESIGAMVTFAVNQGGANAEGAGAGRDALRGLWWALQEFYWINGLPKESLACGSRYLQLRRHGNVLFKQARAFAARGRTDSALAALREAMEQGFDEAKRLDGEPAFDPMRELPEFQELRRNCR